MDGITSTLIALKSIKEFIKDIITTRDIVVIQSKVSELQSKILEAQDIAFTEQEEKFLLSEKIRSLEKEILEFKNWSAEKDKYYLRNFGVGTIVYALKDEPMNKGETFHQICANCYEKQQKSILQFKSRSTSDNSIPQIWYHLFCNNCKSEIQVHTGREKVTFSYLKPSEINW
jgi:hypothetical protein